LIQETDIFLDIESDQGTVIEKNIAGY